ncbi:MAG: hypothetical protein PHW47_02020 [Lachnospira sp.]|jgi:uncharacterized membrane protein YidH (DUF202 family)|nr:hypothetical protein [Lachnospira sp.]
MYYTTSGAYRKSKMIMDYLNIGLTIAIGFIFLIILFLRSKSGILFPIIFALGAVVNATNSVKKFMDAKKLPGIVLAVVTVILLLMAVFTWSVM